MVIRVLAWKSWLVTTANCTSSWKKKGNTLKVIFHWNCPVGRFVEVVMLDGSKAEGKLLSATDEEIVVEEIKGKGKKATTVLHTLPFSQIKTTKIQIKF